MPCCGRPRHEMPKCRAAEEKYVGLFLDLNEVVFKDTDIAFSWGRKGWIHSVELPGDPSLPPVVWIPGYNNGAAFFAPAWKQLISTGPWAQKGARRPTLIAIDPLGWYLSSRPKWTCGRSPEKAERWFVDSFEAWRAARGIALMDLLGHSLGGNIATCYTERHPDYVRTLVLVSPAGVSGEPADYWQKVRPPPGADKARFSMLAAGWVSSDIARVLPWETASVFVMLDYKTWTRGYENSEEIYDTLVDYLKHGWIEGPRSAEYAPIAMLSPRMWGKKPLNARLPKMDVLRVEMMYGDDDWMDVRHGNRVAEACEKSPVSCPDVWVHLLPTAGHHIYLDNTRGFCSALHVALGDRNALVGGSSKRTAEVPESYMERWSPDKRTDWMAWEGTDCGK